VTTTVVPGPGEEISDVATKLLAIAEELGHSPRVVQITHDPGQVFVVPDDVADRYSGDREAAAPPKRRRRAAATDGDETDKAAAQGGTEPAGDEGAEGKSNA